MNKNLGPQIIKLSNEGKNYDEIVLILGCSKGTVSYHLGDGQKLKTTKRRIQYRKKHPFITKFNTFVGKRTKALIKNHLHKTNILIKLKIESFCRNRKTNKYMKPTFSAQDVINKFGNNPKCYLTGESIDINQPRTYSFDHIIPVSRGGDSTIDNLGICTKQANMAKTDMTPDEFIGFCQKVIDFNKAARSGNAPAKPV